MLKHLSKAEWDELLTRDGHDVCVKPLVVAELRKGAIIRVETFDKPDRWFLFEVNDPERAEVQIVRLKTGDMTKGKISPVLRLGESVFYGGPRTPRVRAITVLPPLPARS